MRRIAVAATTCLVVSLPGAVCAAELTWEVENPFRFFKPTSSFALHENAFRSLRGAGQVPFPLTSSGAWSAGSTIRIARTARRPTPAPRPKARVMSKAGSAGRRRRLARFATTTMRARAAMLRNASAVIPGAAPRKITFCPRRIPSRSRSIRRRSASSGSGSCAWSWTPRNGGKAESKTLPCKDKLTIARVPFALDKAASGVSVSVKLPDGRTLTDPYVVVEDILLVALGDSFASGESNPDRPVTFSAVREMVYDPTMQREEQQASRKQKAKPNFELAAAGEKLIRRHCRSERCPTRIAANCCGRRRANSLRLRAARRAMGQPRLPSLAIWLSVPHRHPARIGEPPSRGDAS